MWDYANPDTVLWDFFFPFAKPLCGAVQQQLMASSGDITQANRAVNLTDRTRHPEKKMFFSPLFFPAKYCWSDTAVCKLPLLLLCVRVWP